MIFVASSFSNPPKRTRSPLGRPARPPRSGGCGSTRGAASSRRRSESRRRPRRRAPRRPGRGTARRSRTAPPPRLPCPPRGPARTGAAACAGIGFERTPASPRTGRAKFRRGCEAPRPRPAAHLQNSFGILFGIRPGARVRARHELLQLAAVRRRAGAHGCSWWVGFLSPGCPFGGPSRRSGAGVGVRGRPLGGSLEVRAVCGSRPTCSN